MSAAGADDDLAAGTRALRHGLGLVARSELRLVRIGGCDRIDLLHRVLCSDVKGLAVGRAAPSALLTPKGRVVAALTLLRLEDEVVALVEEVVATTLLEQLDRYVIVDEVSTVPDDEIVILGVYGAGLARAATFAPLRDLAPYEHRRLEVAGQQVLALGDDGLACPGLLLLVERCRAASSREALVQAGAQSVGLAVWESCRIEAGTPRMGSELSEEVLILEAGQLARVSFDKGCYVGQEPVCRVHSRGQVQRMLVGLLLDSPRMPEPGERLSTEGRAGAGVLTSVARSGEGDRFVALGYVHRSVAAPGSRLALGEGGEATVVALPQVDGGVSPRTTPRYEAQGRQL